VKVCSRTAFKRKVNPRWLQLEKTAQHLTLDGSDQKGKRNLPNFKDSRRGVSARAGGKGELREIGGDHRRTAQKRKKLGGSVKRKNAGIDRIFRPKQIAKSRGL